MRPTSGIDGKCVTSLKLVLPALIVFDLRCRGSVIGNLATAHSVLE